MTALAPHPLRAYVSAALFVLLVCLGLLVAPAGSAHAAENDVTWTVRTASNDFGAERTSYAYSVNPGGTLTDALVISNNGKTALDLGFYAADGYTTDSGQFDLIAGGEKSVGVGLWITGSRDRVTVKPGKSVKVPFTLTVPANASPGDYAGGLVTSLLQPDDEAGINVDRRLGIRIALRISGDLVPKVAIEDAQVNWNGGLNPLAAGDATMSYTIHNTGNAVVTAKQSAALTGPFGWFPASADAIEEAPQLLPGERWKVTVPFRGVAGAFSLSATATVTPVVIDASGSTTTLSPIVATVNGAAVPWMLLLIVVLLIAAVFAALYLRKRIRTQRQAREDARVQAAVEEALAQPKELASSDV